MSSLKKTYKYGLLAFLIIGLKPVFAQELDSLKIIHEGYDSELYDSKLVKEIKIKQKLFKKNYREFLQQAIDSCIYYNADIIKVNKYVPRDEVIFKQDVLIADLYQVDRIYKDTIFNTINEMNLKREKNRTFFQKLTRTYPSPKKEEKEPFLVRIKSVESDSIRKSFLDIGGGVGIEYLALLYNINASADFYLLNLKNTKVSISNRSGIIAGISPGVIYYTFPSIKYQQNFYGYWLALSLGREYGKIVTGIDKDNYHLDFRIDLGLRIYNKPRSSIEFYVPIRIGEQFPWYFTGISMNYYYKL